MFKGIIRNKLFKDTAIYGLTNALYTGLPFLLLPFLVAVLDPEDYGMMDLFRSLSMVLTPVLGFSAVQSIGRFYFDLDEKEFKIFVSSIQIFQFGTFLIAILLVFLGSAWISKEYQLLILLCVSYFLLNQFTESLLITFRVSDKPKKYMIFRLLNISLELVFLFVLFKTLTHLDWTFRVYPTVISSFLVASFAWVTFRKSGFKIEFSKTLLKQALIYSSPLILHMISGYILNIGDRFFIKFFLTEADLGNYAVAYQIGMAINFFYTSFNLAWTPTYYRWMKDQKFRSIKKVKRLVYLVVPLTGGILLVVWLLLGSYLEQNTKYEISTHIVLIVLLGNVILSLYKFESNYYLFNKQTKRLSTITFISAFVAIVINVVLIPRMGILGAAYATLFSFIIMYILIILNQRHEKVAQEN